MLDNFFTVVPHNEGKQSAKSNIWKIDDVIKIAKMVKIFYILDDVIA